MSALESLISDLREVCAGLPDRRQGPREKCLYTMADIGLSAFSLFFMGSPSFLAHQRVLAQGHGQSNCQTLFGMAAIPSDNYIRAMLDGAEPSAFDGLFYDALATLAAGDALELSRDNLGETCASIRMRRSGRAKPQFFTTPSAGELTAARLIIVDVRFRVKYYLKQSCCCGWLL